MTLLLTLALGVCAIGPKVEHRYRTPTVVRILKNLETHPEARRMHCRVWISERDWKEVPCAVTFITGRQ